MVNRVGGWGGESDECLKRKLGGNSSDKSEVYYVQ